MNDVSDIALVGVPHRWPAFPYPGLRPFKEFEASIFYGRNKHKDAILERLSDSRMVFITGPSGCGKSSLVKAGVIPALGAGLLTQAGSHWRIALMRPGRRPIENLATELASAFGLDAAKDTEVFTELGHAMEEDQSGLWGAVDLLEDQTTRSSRKQPVLLIVDQFEEIFGPQIRNSSEVDKFVHLVVTQYANPHPRLYVIITCRSDYIGACANFPGLAELINNTQFLASVLDRASLREAITRPAEDYGGRVEEDLVAEILADMETGTIYNSDNLPLMQHALLWLWQNAAGRNSTLVPSPGTYHDEARLLLGIDEYRRGGGMRGILNTHASQVLATSTAGGAEAARIAESMFRRISERDIRGRYHRAPTSFNEICSIANCSREQLEAVVKPFSANDVCFIEARSSRHSPDPLLDVSHESLIRKWRIARVWADQEAEKIRIFRDLLGTAELWQSQNLRPDLLKRRGELQYVEEWWAVEKPASNWAQRYFPVRNGAVDGETAFALVSRYLQTSIETNRAEKFAAEQGRQEQEAQKIEAERQKANADLEVSRRQRDRAVAGVFSVVLLLCAAVGYGYFVTTQKLRLQAQAIALRAEAALEYESPPKAALIAFQSSKFNLPDVPEIERVLYRSVRDLREKRVFKTTGIAVFENHLLAKRRYVSYLGKRQNFVSR